jgi:hypothetical protein
MEFAVEANNLLAVSLEGTVGWIRNLEIHMVSSLLYLGINSIYI